MSIGAQAGTVRPLRRELSRRGRAIGAAIAIGIASLIVPGCDRSSESPPIILILVDTLRADYLGTYGFQGPISPHLDAFASEAIVFERCFSQAPWTKPSIASLFTSLHPDVHRVFSHQGRFGDREKTLTTETLSEEAVTLAEALREGGYATGAFVANPWIRQAHGFGQGFDVYDSHAIGNSVRAEPLLKAASEWIDGLPPDRPYFVYIHLMDVHGPYDAPEEDYEAVRDSPEFGTERIPLARKEMKRAPNYLRRSPWARQNADDVRIWRGRYAANVHAADRRLGKFFEELRSAGILETALVVVTSDHGEQLYEHRSWDHGGSLYEEELHVPLIVRLPDGENGGLRVSSVVSLIDLMPTLITLAGAPEVDDLQGRDLSDSIDDRDDLESVAAFASAVKWKPELHSVRTERYKLIKNVKRAQGELYDLRTDPGETKKMDADSPPGKRMNGMLDAQSAENAARGRLDAGEAELPDRVRERLRALGYEE